MMNARFLRYPTTKMLMLLNHIYFNGLTTFKSQEIYNDSAHFRRVCKKLLRWNVISEKKILEDNRFKTGYVLKGNGQILIEEFIYDYHKCTEKSI